MTRYPLHTLLPFLGTLPFLLGVMAIFAGFSYIPFMGDIIKIIVIYSLMILSFICGSLWGRTLHSPHQTRLILASNLLVVILWISCFTLPFYGLILMMIGQYLILLGIDYIDFKSGHLKKQYMQTRLGVTIIVIGCHICLLFLVKI